MAMNRVIPAAILALLVTACGQPQPDEASLPDKGSQDGRAPLASPSNPSGETTAPDPQALRAEGVGEIIVGQSPPATLKRDAVQISETCVTYSDPQRRLHAITDGNVVMRITAMDGSSLKTARGIAVGASEADVREAYPDAVAQPHKYVETPAKYLDWRPGGGSSGLRFEIDRDGNVSMIHAGREPHLEYVEGCA
ncbi:hypothetical protein ABVV53_02345 [Novosphingobium sp. RD2P27]|uniref:Uncharacterized protein n=1 Tax=Novosphingobium kalidii TaxID=3230299 RepID=A0ABV2CXH9_9SPHN